nr:hypothetical protein [Candidatus Gracilibacteria bacterium]
SKLNKELRLQDFNEILVRYNFSAIVNPNLEQKTFSGFRKNLTLNPAKKALINQNEFLLVIKNLLESLEKKSISQIKMNLAELNKWPKLAAEYRVNTLLTQLTTTPQGSSERGIVDTLKNLIYQYKLTNVMANLSDPASRYYLEKGILDLLAENPNSIDLEIKYLYQIWTNQDEASEKIILDELKTKIDKHQKQVLKLDEDYNLLNALISAYPDLVTSKIMEIKIDLEKYLWDSVQTKAEKVDVALSSYYQDLYNIARLIENNNGQLATEIYAKMFINTVEENFPEISEYRIMNKNLEEEVKSLIAFYEENLHGAAFNQNLFNEYLANQQKEKNAVLLFQKEVSTRSRPLAQDYTEQIDLLAQSAIEVQKENISPVLLGSNLLYIQDANLVPNDGQTFNFVFDPQAKVISQLVWNGDTNLPPLEDGIPLNKFQTAYNVALESALNLNPPVTYEKAVID